MAQEGTAKLNSVQSAAILFYPSHFSVLWLGVWRRSPPMAALGWASRGPITLRASLFSSAPRLSHKSRIMDSDLLYMLTGTYGGRLSDGRDYKFVCLFVVFFGGVGLF